MDVTVKFTGPIADGRGGPEMRRVLDESIKDLMAEGETNVKKQLYPGHGLITGHYRDSIHGEMVSSLRGRIDDSKVVYGPWLEGVSSRNAKSRFKGYSMFRNAMQTLEKMKQGIVSHRISQAVKRLGG